MNKTTHGGKRKRAGRKPAADKKITITVYIQTSVIERAGGMDAIKEKIYGYFAT